MSVRITKVLEIQYHEEFKLIVKNGDQIMFEGILSDPEMKIKRDRPNAKIAFKLVTK